MKPTPSPSQNGLSPDPADAEPLPQPPFRVKVVDQFEGYSEDGYRPVDSFDWLEVTGKLDVREAARHLPVTSDLRVPLVDDSESTEREELAAGSELTS